MMAVDKAALYVPPNLKAFKRDLFERIGRHIKERGGRVVYDIQEIAALPDEIVPIVGCQPESTHLIVEWRRNGRRWCYWDRGYL